MSTYKVNMTVTLEIPNASGISQSDAETVIAEDIKTRFGKDTIVVITECNSEIE